MVNPLDAAIRWIAPGWALRRSIARLQIVEVERLGAYRGAEHLRPDRRRSSYGGTSADWAQEQSYDRRQLVERAQQLERDSLIAEALLSASVQNVVGCGFKLQAHSGDPDWNTQAEALWSDWTEREADSRGISTFDELLALAFRSYLRDGDVGAVLEEDGRLRFVESSEIASREGGIRIGRGVDGIDLDERGRPTRYWIAADQRTPYSDRRLQGEFIEVPADQILFLARRQRLSQTRGISAFSGATWIIEQIDGQIEAVTVAARMAACFGIVLKRAARLPITNTITDGAGNTRKNLHLEPGSILEIDPGESIEQVAPQHPSTSFESSVRLLIRFVARPFGLPLEVALADFSQSNYSSSRGALLQAWQGWRCHQKLLKRFCSRVYAWKLAGWTAAGVLPARADALAHMWMAPGWQWVDPQAEIQAGMAAIDAGFDTATNIAARNGLDYEEIILGRERELAFAEEHGVELSRSNLTREPRSATPPSSAPPGPAVSPA